MSRRYHSTIEECLFGCTPQHEIQDATERREAIGCFLSSGIAFFCFVSLCYCHNACICTVSHHWHCILVLLFHLLIVIVLVIITCVCSFLSY